MHKLIQILGFKFILLTVPVILLFVYKSLNNQAPKYLSDLISNHNPSRSFRSRDHHLLAVPRSSSKRRGDRAFAVVGPKLWNTLPLHVKSASTLAEFKSLLKTKKRLMYHNLCFCLVLFVSLILLYSTLANQG